MVKNMDGNLSNTFTYFGEIIEVGGRCFFTARTTGHCFNLWRSDGTANGTVLVKNICGGAMAPQMETRDANYGKVMVQKQAHWR